MIPTRHFYWVLSGSWYPVVEYRRSSPLNRGATSLAPQLNRSPRSSSWTVGGGLHRRYRGWTVGGVLTVGIGLNRRLTSGPRCSQNRAVEEIHVRAGAKKVDAGHCRVRTDYLAYESGDDMLGRIDSARARLPGQAANQGRNRCPPHARAPHARAAPFPPPALLLPRAPKLARRSSRRLCAPDKHCHLATPCSLSSRFAPSPRRSCGACGSPACHRPPSRSASCSVRDALAPRRSPHCRTQACCQAASGIEESDCHMQRATRWARPLGQPVGAPPSQPRASSIVGDTAG